MAIQDFLLFCNRPKSAVDIEVVKQLKCQVKRGTAHSVLAKNDTSTIQAINSILQSNPDLIPEAVALIKARVKDRCLSTSLNGLDVLDQCIRTSGFEFQHHVVKKVLPRVLKLAAPHKGIHPHVQQKAALLIREWAVSYGSDPHLSEFSAAAAELERKYAEAPSAAPSSRARKSAQKESEIPRPNSWSHSTNPEISSTVAAARRRSCTDLSCLSGMEIAELAKLSQRKIKEQMAVTADPEKLLTLQGLYDQLADDLAVFYANKAEAEAADAAAAQAAVAAARRSQRS